MGCMPLSQCCWVHRSLIAHVPAVAWRLTWLWQTRRNNDESSASVVLSETAQRRAAGLARDSECDKGVFERLNKAQRGLLGTHRRERLQRQQICVFDSKQPQSQDNAVVRVLIG